MSVLGSNYSDLYGSGYNNLQHQLGVGGSNPARPLARQAQVGLGSRVLSQIAFGNSLEPQRQGVIRNLALLYAPGHETAMAARDAQASRVAFNTDRRDADQYDRATGGSGLSPDVPDNALNPYAASSMGYRRYLYSPEYQQQVANYLASLYSMGQSSDIDRLVSGQGAIQQSNMMKDQGNGFGGVLGNLVGGALSGGTKPWWA